MVMNMTRKKKLTTSRNTESHSKMATRLSATASSRDLKYETSKNVTPQSGFQEDGSSSLPLPNEKVAQGSSAFGPRQKPNGTSIVRVSHDEWRQLPRNRTDWARVDALTDEDIAKAVADDPDAAPLDMDWSKARLVTVKPKIAMSIRVDPDVYDFFKATGKGYQTRMNAVLSAFVDHEKGKK